MGLPVRSPSQGGAASTRAARAAVWAVDRGLGLLPGTSPDRWLRPAGIIEAARRRTGLSELGELPYPDSLEVACASLREEADLSAIGAVVVRQALVQAVVNRLALVEAKRRHPEVFAQPLRPPLVVLGLPRTGTTLLSRLLADAPGSRGLPTWKVREPVHLGGPDRRRVMARLALGYLTLMAPDLDRKHAMELDAPEEEVGLFDPSLWLITPWRLAHCPTYLDWVMAQDARPAYHTLRDVLLWLQAEAPERRFVLKLPNHLGWVDALVDAVPDAMIVRTHRDPLVTTASYCSLASSVWGAFSATPNLRGLGAGALRKWGTYATRFEAVRPSLGEQVLELGYEEVRLDVVGAMARIHRHFGLPWSAEAEEAARARAAAQARAHRGGHDYSLQDFGLDRAAVEQAFGSGSG
jgi:hypothetical protein